MMIEFSQPQCITATYKIVTPLFLGGHDQGADNTNFRNASFKGALRFWWRAINWGQALSQAGGDQSQALKNLHRKEGALFGTASDGKNSKQSLFNVRGTIKSAQLQPAHSNNLKSIDYFLGQGLFHFKEGVLRSYLEGGRVEVHLQFKPAATAQDIASVQQAAIALGLLGGLGSRSRKGLGSLSLETITSAGSAPQTFTSLQSITDFLARLDFSAPGNAPFSALSSSSRIDASKGGKSALIALAAVGSEMQLYRSFGEKGKVKGQDARRNFVPDHDNVLAALQGATLKQLPERAVFGLPHNYFFSSTKGKVDINPENEGRRASPLFIHVHALQDGQFVVLQTLLPGIFLPPGMGIDIKAKTKQNLKDPKVDYAVIHRYLDGFAQRQTIRACDRD